MATIYKITNLQNGQIYIGKTIRPVQERWREHKRDYLTYKNSEKNSVPLYNAFIAHGIENFSFEVVEDNIPNEEINEKEKYYIKFYNSKTHLGGYNVIDGGDGGRVSSKLTEQQVKEIKALLKDESNLQSEKEIAKKYNIDSTSIASINTGSTWYSEEDSYPLRKYNPTGLTINKEQYKNIVNDIKNSSLLLKDIGKQYGLSETQITHINQGKNCYNGEHPYYKNIYTGPFPIRQDSRNFIEDEEIYQKIIYDILFTKLSMAKIGEKYGIKGNTLQYFASGKRKREITKDYLVPLRKHLDENQQIYLEKIKGGDAKCSTLE